MALERTGRILDPHGCVAQRVLVQVLESWFCQCTWLSQLLAVTVLPGFEGWTGCRTSCRPVMSLAPLLCSCNEHCCSFLRWFVRWVAGPAVQVPVLNPSFCVCSMHFTSIWGTAINVSLFSFRGACVV